MTTDRGTTTQVLVLGGGYAGVMAALRLDRRMHGRDVRSVLVNASGTFVERIRLHQEAAGQALQRRPIATLLAGSGVELVQATVVGIDAARRRVRIARNGELRELAYQILVYALGSRGDVDAVPGAREHAIPIASAEGASALRERLSQAAASRGRVVVVGGGLTGIESATEIAESWPQARVNLVTAGRLGGQMAAKARRHLQETFEGMGIGVTEGVRIERVRPGCLETVAGDLVPFDLCVWAGSFRALPLAGAAGLEVNARGQIVVDAALRSQSHPEVFAVGDAAFLPGVGMDCASALPMGAHAADGIAALLRGREPRPFGFGYAAKCISLGRRDGIVQHLHADGSPRRAVLSGRPAAFVKEWIGRFTIWALRHPMAYGWPGRASAGAASKAALDLSRA